MVIVIDSVIGGIIWVKIVKLPALTVRLPVHGLITTLWTIREI